MVVSLVLADIDASGEVSDANEKTLVDALKSFKTTATY